MLRHGHFLKEHEYDWNEYLAHMLLFKKTNVAVGVTHTYADWTSILTTIKFCLVLNKQLWLFCSLREEDCLTHSLLQTLKKEKIGTRHHLKTKLNLMEYLLFYWASYEHI